MEKSKLIIVLGMHRSGTSAITRSLELFGVGLGDNLHAANFDNPKGFWEDRECLQINEELLNHLNSAYDQLGLLSDQPKDDPLISDLKIRASQLIFRKLAENNGVWGFKDPRTCRLLPFWQEVIASAGHEVVYIIALRNPLSVAASLQARNNIPHEKSYFLWLQHMLPAIRETAGERRVVVDFDQLLENPSNELHRISSHLRLSPPNMRGEAALNYMNDFLDKELSHSQFSLSELELDNRVPTDVISAYKLFRSAAQDILDINGGESRATVEELYGRLAAFAPAFEYANSLEGERVTLYQSVAQHQSQIAALYQQISGINQQVSSLHEAVGIRDGQISSLHQGVFERDASIARLHEHVAERDNLVSELNAIAMRREAQIVELHQSAMTDSMELSNLRQVGIQDKEYVAKLSQVVEGLKAQIKEFLKTITDQQTNIANSSTAISGLEAQINEAHILLDERNKRVEFLDETIVSLKLTLESNERSISSLSKLLSDQESCVESMSATIGARDLKITELMNTLSIRDSSIAEQSELIAQQELLLNDRQTNISELNDSISIKDQLVAVQDDSIRGYENQLTNYTEDLAFSHARVAKLNNELEKILASKSWRLTGPLRVVRRIPDNIYFSTRKKFSNFSRQFWKALPIKTERKLAAKSFIFSKFGIFLNRTTAYSNWQKFSKSQNVMPAETHAPISNAVNFIYPLKLSEQKIKLIAFYLPQFHPIPENDEWWGKGFTEWTNVVRASPQFIGHYQPHIPSDLGFYDLRIVETQKKQIELAKNYGLGGFCFYFYWFAGKRLLETPILQFLQNLELDFPFCLCWANENWSRRWDGLDQEILIGQQHSPEDDIAFIEYVSKYLLDERYIRIEGKPLLLVYRPSLLPSVRDTAERWRQWCRENGIGEIYLAYTQAFEVTDPSNYGFDAAIEFPPNNSAPPVINDLSLLNADFSGIVYDWNIFVERSRNYSAPDYRLFRGVCPSWDNSARRINGGAIFINSNPDGYEEWLHNACVDTVSRIKHEDERLVFVNAWNEWAEGAHLEPDQRYGHAWLEATRNALLTATAAQKNSILLVTHDCHPHGAQFLLLEMAKLFKANGFNVSILALGDGRLLNDFTQLGQTLQIDQNNSDVDKFLGKLRADGCFDAITSTVVSGRVVPQLKKFGFRVLSLIHELPGVIREMKQEANAETIASCADKIVFPAQLVYQRFNEMISVAPEKVIIRPQGLLRKNPYKNRRAEAHRIVCAKHNLPSDTQIILSVAYVDWRKGADLFVEIAAQVLKERPHTVFIWIGHIEEGMKQKVDSRIQTLGLTEQVLFIGFDREPMVYYAAASAYALTSREDPFPNVVLESAEVGAPIIAFEGASGAGDFIVAHGGRLAPYQDVNGFARHVCDLLSAPIAESRGRVGSLQQYILDLLHHLNGFPRVSVVVPNYNYSQHIKARLDSIYHQRFPIYEVIVLDDASTDDSVEIITEYIENTGIDTQLIFNTSNSGSVFRQWQEGIGHCSGDLLWIAEADDLADNNFLDELSRAFRDADVVLAFSQSKQIDGHGCVLAHNYFDYTKDISECWRADYVRDGRDEISHTLCIKNTIPNVSAVLFRRVALENALTCIGTELFNYRVAGDWLIYLHVLLQGKIYYCKLSLNMHRRHAASVTNSIQKLKHIEEIHQVQVIARTLTAPPVQALAKADAYLVHLYDYFDIPRQAILEGQNGSV
jgi:glycosyltransferase involved in cell wall biosynthesis